MLLEHKTTTNKHKIRKWSDLDQIVRIFTSDTVCVRWSGIKLGLLLCGCVCVALVNQFSAEWVKCLHLCVCTALVNQFSAEWVKRLHLCVCVSIALVNQFSAEWVKWLHLCVCVSIALVNQFSAEWVKRLHLCVCVRVAFALAVRSC